MGQKVLGKRHLLPEHAERSRLDSLHERQRRWGARDKARSMKHRQLLLREYAHVDLLRRERELLFAAQLPKARLQCLPCQRRDIVHERARKDAT